MDEYNRPLYGDVFGVLPKATDINVSDMFRVLCSAIYREQVGEPIEKAPWGELEPEEGTPIHFRILR